MADSLFALLDRLANRPARFGLLLAAIALFGSAILGVLGGLPLPKVHDEFSYLLASDTFASGRIANPSHPMWEHLETFHVIQQPTYVSKYPPAQGLFLALGQVLAGEPILGVWISVALMCWALYWMLCAWLPPRWAVVGGLFALFQFGSIGYWTLSFWGGAVAATGGALVFGGVRRIIREPRIAHGAVLGAGLGMLANSRPFEGFVVGLFAAGALLVTVLRMNRPEFRQDLLRGLLPTIAVLAVVAGAMGFYNLRTTGDPFEMPYQVHSKTYSMSSFVPWKAPRPAPSYRHETLREFHVEYGMNRLQRLRQPRIFLEKATVKVLRLHIFFLGVVGVLPLLGLRGALRDRWTQFAFATVATVTGLSLFTNAYPHYVAPATGLILVVGFAAARDLWERRWARVSGMRLVKITCVLFAVTFLVRVYVHAGSRNRVVGFAEQRADIVASLEATPGSHLVIVRYLDGHHFFSEWVYNRADINGARIVWARDMGPEKNRELTDFFRNRNIWLLTAGSDDGEAREYGAEEVVLSPYTTPGAAPQAASDEGIAESEGG